MEAVLSNSENAVELNKQENFTLLCTILIGSVITVKYLATLKVSSGEEPVRSIFGGCRMMLYRA